MISLPCPYNIKNISSGVWRANIATKLMIGPQIQIHPHKLSIILQQELRMHRDTESPLTISLVSFLLLLNLCHILRRMDFHSDTFHSGVCKHLAPNSWTFLTPTYNRWTVWGSFIIKFVSASVIMSWILRPRDMHSAWSACIGSW